MLPDSFGPRGEREICTQNERRVTPERERAADAQAALDWPAFRAAIAFYPGCAQPLKGAFEPSAPLLILAGGAHVGPHPQARCKALERATVFLERPPLTGSTWNRVGPQDRFP